MAIRHYMGEEVYRAIRQVAAELDKSPSAPDRHVGRVLGRIIASVDQQMDRQNPVPPDWRHFVLDAYEEAREGE